MSKRKTATELEYLKWFRANAYFGPAHNDVIAILNKDFVRETGKDVPVKYLDKDE